MKRLALALFATLALLGCSSSGVSTDDFRLSRYTPRYAEGFELLATEGGSSTLVRVHNPWQGADAACNELLVVRDGEAIPDGFTGSILHGDAERVVCLSSSYIAMIDALGAVERVVGVSGMEFIANDYIRSHRDRVGDIGYDGHLNYELLVALDADLVLLYGVNGASEMEPKLRELKIPYLYVGEYLEQSPLGKAEWSIVLGEVLGLREEAESLFAPLPERYESLRSLAATATHKPRVMLNTPYRDSWFMPSMENYAVRLITDAGGDYLFAENNTSRSVAIDLEEAYLRCMEADFWLNLGMQRSLAELQQQFPRFAKMPCVERGALYNNTRRQNEAGGNDFWESGVMHPDEILADLIHILHPELLPDHELSYYTRLE